MWENLILCPFNREYKLYANSGDNFKAGHCRYIILIALMRVKSTANGKRQNREQHKIKMKSDTTKKAADLYIT